MMVVKKMIETKNFKPQVDIKLLCTCNHPLCDHRSVEQWVLDKVQLVRDDLGLSMVITSGGRCQFHPNEVTKKEPGDHQLCFAVDVRADTIRMRNKLMVLAGRHGATRVAWGKNFVHMAWTPTSDRSVPTWKY